MRNKLAACFTILLLFVMAGTAIAENTGPDWRATFQATVESDGMEKAIAQAMEMGIPVEEIVQGAIEMGFNPYVVIVAAINAGANIGQVVAGAIAAGVSNAVISRAAIDAGTPAFEVGRQQTAEEGFAYTPPPGTTPTLTGADLTGAEPEPITVTAIGPQDFLAGIVVGGGADPIYVSPFVPR